MNPECMEIFKSIEEALKDGGSGLNDYVLSIKQGTVPRVPTETPSAGQMNDELPPAPLGHLPGSTPSGAVPMRKGPDSDFKGYSNLNGRQTFPLPGSDGPSWE